MPRKIKAKTLARLVSRYLRDFESEAAERLADAKAEEGAELLGLLPGERAWGVLRALPEQTARRWLACCAEDALVLLVRHADPDAQLDPGGDRAPLEQRALAILARGSG